MHSSETVSVCSQIHSFLYRRHGVILINAFIVNIWWMGTHVLSSPFSLQQDQSKYISLCCESIFLCCVMQRGDPIR
jgi:hypothetical protein